MLPEEEHTLIAFDRSEVIFDSDSFKSSWSIWKEYKKTEHKFNYKSAISEQAALKELSTLSGTNEEAAVKIIEQSISKGWKGFFKLENNGKQKGFNPQNFDLQGIDAYINE